jgi:hypothetical protein
MRGEVTVKRWSRLAGYPLLSVTSNTRMIISVGMNTKSSFSRAPTRCSRFPQPATQVRRSSLCLSSSRLSAVFESAAIPTYQKDHDARWSRVAGSYPVAN